MVGRMSDALATLTWYVLIGLFGLAAWPFAFRHLRALPDRGYTLSRALGLLLTGYVFWLLASLGLLRNTPGGMLFALLIVGGLAIWQYTTRPAREITLAGWMREHARLVIVAEGLFLIAFVGWTVVRAYNPELNSTEKPMELTFLNGIRMSRVFPPRDPWLSGYAISYYYFGYVMVAMLADLSGVASGVAFNLAIAMLFALACLGAYGLAYNMLGLARRAEAHRHATPARQDVIAALLGPLLAVVMGNLEGGLEVLRALRVLPFSFWQWLDIRELNEPLDAILWPPDKWRFWWWWRASRVIHDRTLIGVSFEPHVIDEFPMFSFLLGDMHPHVLALPFALLALGLALNLLARERGLSASQFALYGVCLGGLAFLNTWDWPIYLFVVVIAEGLRRTNLGQPLAGAWGRAARFGVGLVAVGVLAYLPFYIGFSSQASGILPNALFPTRWPQFFVMFGPLLFVVAWFVAGEAWQHRRRLNWRVGMGLSLLVLALLIFLMVIGSAVALFGLPMGLNRLLVSTGREPILPYYAARDFLLDSAGLSATGQSSSDAPIRQALGMAVRRRLSQPWLPISLVVLAGLSLSLVARRREDADPPGSLSDQFVLGLALTGALLTLAPEFVYLRDTFQQRMNTVFKFYYATWVLWSVAAAYAIPRIARHARPALRSVFVILVAVLIVAGLAYPVIAVPTKTGDFAGEPTLDGTAFLEGLYPDDVAAIRWLQANADPDSVVLEAVGGQYSTYGRVAELSGLPTVLGWPGHELQWRGPEGMGRLAGGREDDICTLYGTRDSATTWKLLGRYGVDYVFVGVLERNADYATPGGLAKFDHLLTPVFRQGQTVIYRVESPPAEQPTAQETSP
jgi:YYY domain-containing protein